MFIATARPEIQWFLSDVRPPVHIPDFGGYPCSSVTFESCGRLRASACGVHRADAEAVLRSAGFVYQHSPSTSVALAHATAADAG